MKISDENGISVIEDESSADLCVFDYCFVSEKWPFLHEDLFPVYFILQHTLSDCDVT